MKQITYNGSSKLISRIVALLNGKAPLPLDADENVDWGTSGQVLTTDGSGSTAWADAGSGGTTYTMSISDHTLTLTDGDGNVQTVTLPDNDTTYTMTISGTTLTLTDSDGTVQSVTIPDDDTTYTFSLSDHTLTITPSSGDAQTITLPDNDTTYTMSLSDSTLTLTDSDGTAQTATFATVATSGSYNDLSDTPTIPTVNDATLTIQRNGTDVQTFTANQSTDATADIIVPNGTYYGTCSTAAATAAKVVTVSSDQNFALAAGVIVGVRFTYTNTYSATSSSNVTLNVNSTGAKNIYWGNTGTPTGTNTTAFGRANYINYYMYDGTYWVWTSSSADNNTTYSVMSVSELTTGTATTSRVVRATYLNTGIQTMIDDTIGYFSVVDGQVCITYTE